MTALARLLTAVLLLFLALTPAEARASGRWSGHRVAYRDLSGYPEAVAAAVAAWNASPAWVTLVPARRKRHARVVLRTTDLGPGIAGMAEDPPGGHVSLAPDLAAYDFQLGLPAPLTAAAETAAHELGHALGLSHSHGACDLMNPSGYYNKPECEPAPGFQRCGPQAKDVSRMVAKYGWRPGRGPGELAGLGVCPAPAPTDAPPDDPAVAPDEGDPNCTTTSDGDSSTTVCTYGSRLRHEPRRHGLSV